MKQGCQTRLQLTVRALWRDAHEWFDGLRTHCVKVEAGLLFRNGKIEVRHRIPEGNDQSYARSGRNAHRVVVFCHKACGAYYKFGVARSR